MTGSGYVEFNPSILKIAKSINGTNVAFVIDSSDSSQSNLDLIKAYAIELIDIFMCQISSYSFNVISFSENYSKLSNVLLPFCKSTVTLANDWIQTLNSDTSRNTLLALGTAYTDDDVDAVVLLTDGLMTQRSPEIIKCVTELSLGRPLHVVYINEENEDEYVIPFLQNLAACTDGTLHAINESQLILGEEHVYPEEDDGVDEDYYSSSDASSCDEYIEIKKEEEEKVEEEAPAEEEDEELKGIKLLGTVVLAKRNSNGCYYKGTVIKTTSSNEDAVVLFDLTNDRSAQLQQVCLIKELIMYEEAKEQKIYADDKVLVNLDGKRRFIPATVLKKEYVFDDNVKDDVNFKKIIEVEFLNGETKKMAITSAIHISPETFEMIVTGIKEAAPKREKEEEETAEETNNEEAEKLEGLTKGFLREKIERQLRESEEFLKTLHTQAREDLLYSGKKLKGFHSDSSLSPLDTRCRPKSSRFRKNKQQQQQQQQQRHFYSDTEGMIPPYAHAQPTLLASSIGKEKHCTFQPHPPTWNNSTKMKRSTHTNPRAMRRSNSVGCNVVELSKKHWKGRPTSKEVAPKRPFNERYVVRPTTGVPKAEEYQTPDGVPFPVKTDNKFRRPLSSSWTPNTLRGGDYVHHDIIGHRVVYPGRPSEKVYSYEEKEKKRITARRNKQLFRREVEAKAKESKVKQTEARDEQVRKAIEDRIKDEVSKLHISIEKGDEVRRGKQHKHTEHRIFEREREGKNQERKHTRIAARREKKKNYLQLEDERAAEPEVRDQQIQTVNRLKSERRSEFERSRINKQIEDHESKIDRLKGLRRTTEARFRSMRRDNDNHRDIKAHVRDQQEGITRASILP